LGRDLGAFGVVSVATFASAATAFAGLVEQALGELAQTADPLIQFIGGLGIRLHTHLPTRVFEMAVHSLDIAGAVGIPFSLPADVLDEATALAARIAAASGQGEAMLLALTGRAALPAGFSVV
jgi:hypothetical protein